MEAQAPVRLQRRMLAPDAVHLRDERRKAVGARAVPAPDLVLLGVEVLLAAGHARRVLHELVGGAVDPVVGRECGREQEAQLEGRRARVLQMPGQDVRRVRPAVRAEVFACRRGVQFSEVLGELLLGLAPGEIRVRLRESHLRKPVHHARAGESLRQEDHLRMLAPELAERPFPERERLGVRVVHPEDAHALPHPVHEHAVQLAPERAPFGALEVERVDVLVLLGRVLRAADRAVRVLREPFRVRVDIGVARRALEGDVERDLHAPFVGGAEQRKKVFGSAEVRMEGLVPALLGADRPRAAHVAGHRLGRVVPAFAQGAADRVDRRQVEHVEAHGRDRVELPEDIRERAVGGFTRTRARKKLVPGAETRTLALHAHRVLLRSARRPGRRRRLAGRVHNGFDREAPQAQPVGHEGSVPAVVAQRLHRHRFPVGVFLVAIGQRRHELVVTVGKAIGFDFHAVIDHALGRMAAIVHRRRHRFDDRPRWQRARQAHRDARRAQRPSGLRTSTPSGGNTSSIEKGRPCECVSLASTRPRLPCPLPP